MPIISRFYGIVVFMNYREHGPPHFHARYQDYEITVEITSGLVSGKMPRRALRMILDWADMHQQGLIENWRRSEQRLPLKELPPLD